MQILIQKITKAKRAGNVAQMVEYLRSKCNAQVQTSVPPKKKDKEHLL
jgi:hypothetical protein